MAVDDPKKITPLFLDMAICANHLHCTHEQFEKLPRREKLLHRMFMRKTINMQQKDPILENIRQPNINSEDLPKLQTTRKRNR